MRRVCVVLALAASTTAGAEPPGGGLRGRLELGAGTAVPLALDLEASLHPAERVVLDLAVGYLPPPYVDLIDRGAGSYAAYDDAAATVLQAALEHAFVVRVGAGYQPFGFPLSVHAGYSLVALGGGTLDAALVEAKTEVDLREDAGPRVPIASTIHLLALGAAYRVRVRRDLVLRVSLEYTQPFASATRVDVTPRTMSAFDRIARANTALDAYVGDVFTSYVKSPVLGVSLRWLR